MTKLVVPAPKVGTAVLIAALTGTGACAMLVVAGQAPAWVLAVAFIACALTIAVGVTVPSSGVFAQPILGSRTDRAEVALTFDDGPDPRWTPAILDLLEARGQRATFFVIGARAERNLTLLKDIARRGHEIANHSWHHSYATVFVHPRNLADELDRASTLIEQSTGARPRWFRPPVGLLSPRIAPALALAGLRLVAWTATARDGIQSASAPRAFSRLDRALAPGAILVLHDALMHGDGEPIARHVLPLLLDRMEQEGLKSVTLSALCGAAIAQPAAEGGADAALGRSPLLPASAQAGQLPT